MARASRSTPRSDRPLRGVGVALAFGGLAFLLGVSGGACSSSSSSTTGTTSTSTSTSSGNPCVGGVIVNGVCEGKCDPAKCVANNACVNNACELKCTSNRDCAADGTQDCKAAKEDDTMADITTCQPNGLAPGFGVACPFGKECAAFTACPDGKQCDMKQCGGNYDDCKMDMTACAGVMNCTIGQCSNGDACTVPSCAKADCTASFVCNTKGEADADAYCTHPDCTSDADCPGGYECTVERDPRPICGLMPPKGNDNICGKTNDPCVAPADFMKNGATYQEGPVCLMRNVCKKRDQCAPCKTDLDCSEHDGESCVMVGGESRCAKACVKDGDCALDYKCGGGHCLPRAGKCKTDGGFCAPCQTDLDCGDKTTHKACVEVNNLRHQFACFDTGSAKSCMTDADCPASPSGKHGGCLDDRWGVSAGGPGYHTCYFPAIYANGQVEEVTCW